jgi:hypothetical protein
LDWRSYPLVVTNVSVMAGLVRPGPRKSHSDKESALNRALAIYRNPAWGLKVLYIEQANGMRMYATVIAAWCERAASER